MQNFFSNWTFMRVVRVLLGIFVIGQGIASKQWIFVALGAVFTLMPLFNVGCCANNNCTIAQPKKTKP